jgi:hypothetical protein
MRKDKRKRYGYDKEYYHNHREKINKYNSEWQKNNRDKLRVTSRRYRLKKNFGLTEDQYNQLLEKQSGKCAICKVSNNSQKYFPVDHDHITGKVRGLLCISCNMALGKFRDSKEIVKAALDYLSA